MTKVFKKNGFVESRARSTRRNLRSNGLRLGRRQDQSTFYWIRAAGNRNGRSGSSLPSRPGLPGGHRLLSLRALGLVLRGSRGSSTRIPLQSPLDLRPNCDPPLVGREGATLLVFDTGPASNGLVLIDETPNRPTG